MSTPVVRDGEVTEDVDAHKCLFRATDALTALQHPEGWWKGELETNVTIDAEDLLLREFLGIRTEAQTASTARWIRAKQRNDGSWATFHGGPADLSTTVEAYVALRLAGDAPDEPHMRSAARVVAAQGGVECSRVFTKIWLALFGLWSWDDVPIVPPELVFLPRWVPLNVYDFACWARQTIVALSVVCAYRPTSPLSVRHRRAATGDADAGCAVAALLGGPLRAARPCPAPLRAAARPVAPPPRALASRALDRPAPGSGWLVGRHPAPVGVLAHRASPPGLPARPPVAACRHRWTGRLHDRRRSGPPHRGLPVAGLGHGTCRDRPGRCRRSARRRVARGRGRVPRARGDHRPGDWSVNRPELAPGGWAFEFANDTYPDVDDTAEVALALCRTALDAHNSVDRAVAWMEGMQSRDGGWASFDVDNTETLCRALPFCDFGELIDPPSADVTAHVVECLAALGGSAERIDRGVRWLLAAQEADGSWFGRWGANHVYGTGAVGARARGRGRRSRAPRGAPGRLVAHESPERRRGVGRGPALVRRRRVPRTWSVDRVADVVGAARAARSRRAWHRAGLARRGLPRGDPARGRHVDEPWFHTGTGFPGDFYLNYHLYRLVFPVMAFSAAT